MKKLLKSLNDHSFAERETVQSILTNVSEELDVVAWCKAFWASLADNAFLFNSDIQKLVEEQKFQWQ